MKTAAGERAAGMWRGVKRIVPIFVLTTCMVVPAASQSSVGIGPQLGIYKVRDVDEFRFMGGAALRVRMSDLLGAEASVNYRAEDYGNANGTVTVKTWPVMVTGLVYPVPAAYGAIGAGWYNTTMVYSLPQGYSGTPYSSNTNQEFGWHFGGGVELSLGVAMKLVGDIRYVFLDYNFENFPGTEGVNSDFYIVTAGLLFGL